VDNHYTEPVTLGKQPSLMLPAGTALILEGGGTRGFFSAGVLDAFMDAGIMFPYIAGVSAGAANSLSYVSGQRGRNRLIAERYVGLPQYLGIRNLLRQRSLFGFDFVLKTVPQQHVYWDKTLFDEAPVNLLTGAIDCQTGQTVWFDKQHVQQDFDVIRASCSIPLVSPIVEYDGYQLLDGGISSPISIDKSLADGNRFHVVILTRNAGYQKPPLSYPALIKLVYRRYPQLVEAMLNRHLVYQRQLDLVEQLAAEGKAVIIRPRQPVQLSSTSRDVTEILRLHDEGHELGTEALPRVLEWV